MLHVYLDQNKWIDLGRAKSGDRRGVRYLDVYEDMKAATLARTASFPLSSVHLAESWKAGSEVWRKELAAVMMELSRRDTIAPIVSLIPAETQVALHHRFGKPPTPLAAQPFGTGLRFAVTGDPADSDPAEPFNPTAALAEHLSFFADNSSLELATYVNERNARDSAFRDAEERLRSPLSQPTLRNLDSQRAFVALAVQAIGRELTHASIGNGIPVSAYADLGLGGFAHLFSDIPTVWALTRLRLLKYGNAQHPWQDHDLSDLKAFSVAGVYCDVVVAERTWIGYMRQAGFPERFGTRLLTDLSDLRPLLRPPGD